MQASDLLDPDFYKKETFKGSIHGMCYRVAGKIREEELPEGSTEKPKKFYHFQVTVWPGPLCFEKTDEALKQTKDYPECTGNFSRDDLAAIADDLNKQYEEQKALWDTVRYK